MYIDRERKIAFIMHPRAGSTSLASLFSDFERLGTRHSIEPEIIEPDWKVACVLRNPFDTLVSWFYVSRFTNFQEWLDSDAFKDHIWISGCMFFGLPYATHIIRYEHLQRDYNEFCIKAGWIARKIPHLNLGVRRKGRPWQEVVAGCKIPEIKLC